MDVKIPQSVTCKTYNEEQPLSVAAQVMEMLEHVRVVAQGASENADKHLAPLMLEPGPFPDVRTDHDVLWPPLFSEMRDKLWEIEESLNRINAIIFAVEL